MSQERPPVSDVVPDEACQRFRTIVENSQDVLCIRDADGRVRYASPSIQHVLGYSQEQLVGSTGLELLHPDDRSTVENAMQKFWKNSGARGSMQYRALHANGSWVSLEVVAYNLLDDPEVRGVVTNGRDISERKQADAETKANSSTGHLSICASCKKIKKETGRWQQIETYIRERFQIEFSHGMCPACAKLWYP